MGFISGATAVFNTFYISQKSTKIFSIDYIIILITPTSCRGSFGGAGDVTVFGICFSLLGAAIGGKGFLGVSFFTSSPKITAKASFAPVNLLSY